MSELKTCPYCGENAECFNQTEYQSNSIECTNKYCPVGLEHCDMSLDELKEVWNSLPRNEN